MWPTSYWWWWWGGHSNVLKLKQFLHKKHGNKSFSLQLAWLSWSTDNRQHCPALLLIVSFESTNQTNMIILSTNHKRMWRNTVELWLLGASISARFLTTIMGRTQGETMQLHIERPLPKWCLFQIIYRVSHKKVYPFEVDLVIIEFKSLAYVSHTIG